MVVLSKRNKEVVTLSNNLKKERGENQSEVEGLVHERGRLEDRLCYVELERKAEAEVSQRQIDACRDVTTSSQTKKSTASYRRILLCRTS